MSKTTNLWWLWALTNLLGMTIFLHIAAQTWIEPELANEPGANSGEFIVWGISALPVFLIFMLAHFALGFVAHRQQEQSGTWRGTIFVGATFICWIAVFLYDNAHHGIA